MTSGRSCKSRREQRKGFAVYVNEVRTACFQKVLSAADESKTLIQNTIDKAKLWEVKFL